MAPVTVKTTANVAGGSGNTGWSARSLFAVTRRIFAADANGASNVILAGGATVSQEAAQSYTPGSTFDLKRMTVVLAKTGSPTDNVYCEIQTDSAGVPSGSVITNGTSDTITATGLSVSIYQKSFVWTTPPTLTGSTKYWFVFKRSGAGDDSNNVQIRYNSTASMVASAAYATRLAGAWTVDASGLDLFFSLEANNAATDLYAVVQDTKLRVYLSTDNGANWTEQDSANAPTVNSATKPFSASYARVGGLAVAYFSGTNTARVRRFDTISNSWASGDLFTADATTDADFNRNLRLVISGVRFYLFHTSLADDADLIYRSTTSSWSGATTLLAATDADASSYIDAVANHEYSGFTAQFWQDISTDTVKVQTISTATAGTATNIDATGADTEAEHVSGVFQSYDTGSAENVIAAFIDADGTLEERILTLGVTAASISQATQHEVSSATSYAGRQLATCVYGSDAYVIACTGTGIDIFKDIGIAGSWAAAVNWKSGLTNCFLSSVTPIAGVGILVIYNDNGDVKTDLLSTAINVAGTTATATGTANAGVVSIPHNAAGATATGSATANAGSLTIPSSVAGTTATVTGSASAGSPQSALAGTTATATSTANTGSVNIPRNISGTTATVNVAANAGTIAWSIPAATAVVSAVANAGSLAYGSNVTGATASALGAAASGTPNIAANGLAGTVAVGAFAGTIASVVGGLTAVANADANAGVFALTVSPNGTLAGALSLAHPLDGDLSASSVFAAQLTLESVLTGTLVRP